jgi:hypothetical protein
MTRNGALPGKQILDFFKEPVLQCSISINGSPNSPALRKWSTTDTWHILTQAVSTIFATRILPQKLYHSYRYHNNTNAKLMTNPQQYLYTRALALLSTVNNTALSRLAANTCPLTNAPDNTRAANNTVTPTLHWAAQRTDWCGRPTLPLTRAVSICSRQRSC